LNNILAKIEAQQAGCMEALMLNHKGEVAECTADNIFLVRDGVLLTPPTDAGVLEGITREAVIELARASGREVREVSLTRHDVYIADECYDRHGGGSSPWSRSTAARLAPARGTDHARLKQFPS
jgi:branched-chain amino acid aminotransferase